MNAEQIATSAQLRTPDSWRLTWSGSETSFAAIDPNGLIVYASQSEIFNQTGLGDEQIIDAVLWAAEEKLQQFKTWEGIRSTIFPAPRSSGEIFPREPGITAPRPSLYQSFAHPLAPSLVAVPSSDLDSHMTMIPDQTLRDLGVSKSTLWRQAFANLTTWFRSRDWFIQTPNKLLEILGDGPIPLFSGDPRCSVLPMIPALLREVAHEMALPTAFCFSIPSEGAVLFSYDTQAGRAILSSLTTTIYLKSAMTDSIGEPLSPDIFRLVENIPTLVNPERH